MGTMFIQYELQGQGWHSFLLALCLGTTQIYNVPVPVKTGEILYNHTHLEKKTDDPEV